MTSKNIPQTKVLKRRLKRPANLSWVWDILIIVVLLIGAYFRFTGLNWDANYHLHPDERFLTMVENAISPVESISDYFNTDASSLNPNNRGYTFYVYGTLPIFIVRYVGELVGKTGYDKIHLVGRAVSGAFDLGTILLIFLIGRKLYKNSKLGLLAALFSALAVLQIQLSHYFTVDNVANFFVYAAIYTAILIMMREYKTSNTAENEKEQAIPWEDFFLKSRHIGSYVLFGILYGMALASKVSVFALALLLPAASLVYYSRIPKKARAYESRLIIRNLVVAGILAFVTFRVFQPYAFLGPGFFGMRINQDWIASLKELSIISSGVADVPYALQWARRPLTFAVENLVKWGLGLTLGLLGLAGFIWMAWRIIKGDWQKHILVWGWAAYILITQSINWVRSMRYLLPLYPALCLIAAWTIFKLWENGNGKGKKLPKFNFNWRRLLSIFITVITIVGSAGWAFAFLNIYQRPITRVEASEWIYENIDSAIEMPITTDNGEQVKQLLAYQNTVMISATQPYTYGFTAHEDGEISSISLEHVLNLPYTSTAAGSDDGIISMLATIKKAGDDPSNRNLGAGFVQSNFMQISDARGEPASVVFNDTVQVKAGQKYEITLSVIEPDVSLQLDGGAWLTIIQDGEQTRQYLPPPAYRLTGNTPYQVTFLPLASGRVSEIDLNRVVDLLNLDDEVLLEVTITDPARQEEIIGSGMLSENFSATSDPRGEGYQVVFDEPVVLDVNSFYHLNISLLYGESELAIYNDVEAIESTWDDALPLAMYSYDLYGYASGIWGNVRNMELYYNDTQSKKDSLYTTLDLTDAIFISSSRQWGSIVRVPERYPLTTEYYRALIGCPTDKDILWCYETAEPGMFNEELGFKLTAVFQSDPTLAGIAINDQPSEEAFTVYDHPKVLIFEKTADYNPQKMRAVLDQVDISTAVYMTPGQASKFEGNLMLGEKEKQLQQSGGTWSKLFPANSILNTQPWVAAIVWYLFISILGLIVYPIVRVVFHGLPDRGYPFSRLTGMILMAYLTWLAASTAFTFSRLTIGIVLGILVLLGGFLAFRQRKELLEELKTKKHYFLNVELLTLVLFLIFLGIRYGNPDLWHPWRGGEKPMDLSYFTAVIKSTVFPPYDPWYAGGYINYYYYGFVLTGVPVKLLGIEPGIAYNLILPTLFAVTGLGAYSFGWNVFARKQGILDGEKAKANRFRSSLAGYVSVFTVLIMGNLGTIRMIGQGIERLAAPGGVIDSGGFFQRMLWFFRGLGSFFSGNQLIFGIGDWYWVPSRAIPGDVITEFPFFTFTYADLHAHMIALPITLLVIGWGLGILLGKWNWENNAGIPKWWNFISTLLFGGLVIGMLRATNTWDFPTYLLLSCLVILYTIVRYGKTPGRFLPAAPGWIRNSLYSVIVLGLVAGSTFVFFLPFTDKFYQAYGSIALWTGDHSPLSSYLVHWGVQFFIIATWFIWETREWLAATPLSSVKPYKAYFGLIQALVILFVLTLALITLLGIKIGWLAGLLGAWALLLMLRPNQPDGKRLVLFMTGTALVLTLFVEGFVLAGDIGRMNTVFKFYYQAWTLLGLSAAAALIWLIPAVISRWRMSVSAVWQVVMAVLIFGAAMYPITAATDKIRDRMSETTPNTLDGLKFMTTSQYFDQTGFLDLNQDYQAILWMQQNVEGSPVIVEANTVEYRWGNRFTIYTGLPGVLGWNWHQRQQRGGLDYDGIVNRLNQISDFYLTTDIQSVLSFLKNYDVSYIILGQMERAYYEGEGMDKFEEYDGVYWKEVFHEGDTSIYQVIEK